MSAWNTAQKRDFRATHTVNMPRQQRQHNYPHADVKSYFGAIFAADCEQYKGMVTIAAMKKD